MTIDNSDPRRDEIHELLQRQGPPDFDKSAVLTGWVVVTEWMDEDGERWLSRGHAASIPTWHANGLHHEVLYGDWPEDDDA